MTTASTETKKSPELKADVLTISALFAKTLKVDGKAGTASVADDLYKESLPSDLTIEIVKKVHDHDTTFVAAGIHALGMATIPVMAKNKSLETVALHVPTVGKNSFDFSTDRSKVSRNPQDPENPVTKYAVTSVTITTVAGKNAGQYKAARQFVCEAAFKAFAGK